MSLESRREKWKERNKVCQTRHREKLRHDALFHCSDGKMKCVVCGNKKKEDLCIKHVEGKGWEYKVKIGVVGGEGGTKLYRWLRDHGYPKEFRTVCKKCNFRMKTIATQVKTRKEAHDMGISDRTYYRAKKKYGEKE